MNVPTLSRRALLGAAAATLAAASGCARPVDPGTGGASPGKPLKVGLIVPLTGDKAAGTRFAQALTIGLTWTTTNTNQVGVRKIKVARADEADAAFAADQLISEGCQILVGGLTSGPALQVAEIAGKRRIPFIAGTATADELTGLNEYTFRAGVQQTQLLLAARTLVRGSLTVLAADRSTAEHAAAVLGATSIIVGDTPATIKTDQVYVDRPPADAALWAAIPRGVETITVLGARDTWPAYGTTARSLKLVTAYVDGATNNNGLISLRRALPEKRIDTGHVEGFAAAQLVVRALQAGPETPAEMVAALAGFTMASVKGDLVVRAQDHCLIQPVWGARLDSAVAATPTTEFDQNAIAPPL